MLRGPEKKTLSFRINLSPEQLKRFHLSGIFLPLIEIGTGFLVLLILFGISHRAFGADLSTMSGPQATSTVSASDAKLLKSGQSAASLFLKQNKQLWKSTEEASQLADDEEISTKLQQMSASLGLGISSFLEFDFSIRGIHESYSGLQTHAKENENNDNDKQTTSASSFAGASIFAKIGLYQGQELQLALSPFIESASGKDSNLSLGRSAQAKGGWMLLSSYEAANIMKLNLNGGYRYREREEFAGLSLRNEVFYMASIEAMFSQYASVFVSTEGRRIKISEESEYLETGKRIYKNAETTSLLAGLLGKVQSLEITGFGGTTVSSEKLGAGQSIFGINLAYVFGGARNSPHLKRVMMTEEDKAADQDKADQDALVDMPNEAKHQKKKATNPNATIDPYGNEIDIMSDAELMSGQGDNDDFSVLKKRIDVEKVSHKNGPSEDEIVEAELEKIYEVESKKKAEEERILKQQENAERVRSKKELKARELENRRLRKKILEEEDIPEITDEDANWRGLR